MNYRTGLRYHQGHYGFQTVLTPWGGSRPRRMEPGLHGLGLEEDACSGGINQPKCHFRDQLDAIEMDSNRSQVLCQNGCQLFLIIGFDLQQLVALIKSDELLATSPLAPFFSNR